MSPEKIWGYPKWVDGKRIDGPHSRTVEPTLEDLWDRAIYYLAEKWQLSLEPKQ
jgi:hypothetical protein